MAKKPTAEKGEKQTPAEKGNYLQCCQCGRKAALNPTPFSICATSALLGVCSITAWDGGLPKPLGGVSFSVWGRIAKLLYN